MRQQLIRYVAESPAFSAIVSRLATRTIVELVFRRKHAQAGFGASGILAMMGEQVLPGLELRIESVVSRYCEEHTGRIAREIGKHLVEVLDADGIREFTDELFDQVADKPLGSATAFFTPRTSRTSWCSCTSSG